ncbi:MAG: DNA primase [Candidatus Omnitrophica bacterium]|nr:DNA primase [Candidatus Omnitrophota bacterium]
MGKGISSAQLEEIISKIDIVDVISEYLKLKKTGRNFKALCPFHQEKTPSFIVNPEKQIFHCFGCGEGGNVIRFLMKMDNISFPKAVALAAKKAGVKISLSEYTEDIKEDKIFKANEFASVCYKESLFSSQGGRAMNYLTGRNITEKDIKQFHLGFAPGVKNYLVKKVTEKNLDKVPFINAGLINKDGETDIFRNRIIFPIFDIQGRIAGFGGRAMDEEQLPKYLNTGENEVFNKGKLLYGIYQAKTSIKERQFVFLVEGYFDVIKLYINGIQNVVAPMGTALTDEHLRFLKRFTEKILLAFDSDEAGLNASLRNLESILKMGFETKICMLPVNFDPDRFIDEYGIEPFKKVMGQSMDFLDFALNISSRRYDINTPKGKSSIAKEIVGLISLIPDEIERYEYVKALSIKLNLEEKVLRRYLDNKKSGGKNDIPREEVKKEPSYSHAENLLMEIILSEDDYWQQFLEWNGRLTKRLEAVAITSRELLNNNIEITPANLINHLDEETGMWLSGKFMKVALIERKLEKEKKMQIFQDCLKKIHKYCLSIELEEIKKKITEKKDMGIPYYQEMEVIQSILFELKKE